MADRIREEVSRLCPDLSVLWVGVFHAGEPEGAIVGDRWGQYEWPWIAEQRGLVTRPIVATAERTVQSVLF